jgi:hypothetical protein
LGTNKSTVSSWRGRNSVPIDVLSRFAIERGSSLDWLLLGRGSRDQAGSRAIDESPAGHDVRMDAVLQWWRRWWSLAGEDERTWALVQLRRAFPEFREWRRQ